jgi:hypothetical protein
MIQRSQETRVSAQRTATARRPLRRALLCIGAVASTLALGANANPAHAAAVSKVALADLSGFRLEFKAGAGERNLVTVTGNPLVLDVGDRGALEGAFPAGFAARQGCRHDFDNDEFGVVNSCLRRGTDALLLTLGDGNDRLAFTRLAFLALPPGLDKLPIEAQGGPGSDVLDASGLTVGSARLLGEEGGDFLTAGIDSGDVELVGGPGPDTLTGGPGEETASYEDHAAGVIVTLDDIANDGSASDELAGVLRSPRDNVKPDVEGLIGSAANDTLTGGAGDETIEGLGGSDALSGLAGDDRLRANDGERDRILCGPGEDRASIDLQDRSGDPNVREGAFPDCELLFGAAVDSHPTVRIARQARLTQDSLQVTLHCPRALPAGCAGHLSVAAADGARPFAGRRYARIRPGARRLLRLPLRSARAGRALRNGVRLRATALERDRLGRPKTTLAALRVRPDPQPRRRR